MQSNPSMSSNWLRIDSRFFYRAFIVFNILLAVYNMICFRIPKEATPCILILNANGSPGSPSSFEYLNFNTSQALFLPRQPLASITTPASARPVPAGNLGWSTETHRKYIVIKNYLRGTETVSFNSSVTLTTQATHEFLHHAEELCKRWRAPLSLSVYAPGTDMNAALFKIAYLRSCRDPCVTANITWHFVYDAEHGPKVEVIPDPFSVMGNFTVNCSVDISQISLGNYRKSHKLSYPINVLRNVARTQAATRFVLASDIELYPSENIVPRFLNLVKSEGNVSAHHVYVLPIFEVKQKFNAPKTKKELVGLVNQKAAIFFHKWVCDSCQNFPGRDRWIKTVPPPDELNVFIRTKREKPRTAWEPIYIGTNDEPLYAEELTWEGKRDKMSQMYELCHRGYEFHILDNAFLCHAPGIKVIRKDEESRRSPYIRINNGHYGRILKEIRNKYGAKKEC